MKATMKTEELREALQKVNFVGRMRLLPVLSNVRMDFSNGKAKLTTTNMEQAIHVEVDSTNDEIFSMLLPRRTTSSFLYGANGKVSISQGRPKNATVEREGIGQIDLGELPDEKDFPPIPEIKDTTWHTLDAKWFCRMLGIVTGACAKEASRPVLTGIACKDGEMAAADGFRLVRCKSDKLNFGLGPDKQAIIPASAATMVRQLFSKEETLEIGFEITKSYPLFGDQTLKEQTIRRVYFRSGNTTILSDLTQGKFPNYEQLIPDHFSCKVSFSTPLMLQRLRMIDYFDLVSGIIRLSFQKNEAGEHECLMNAGIDDFGHYAMRFPVKIVAGEEARIAFNHKYIEEAIRHFSMCSLELTSPSSPGIFTGDIEEVAVLVMPMFVTWD